MAGVRRGGSTGIALDADAVVLCSLLACPDIQESLPCPQVGTRYRLEKVLGYGSFSCVCLATDTQTGEKVGIH